MKKKKNQRRKIGYFFFFFGLLINALRLTTRVFFNVEMIYTMNVCNGNQMLCGKIKIEEKMHCYAM